MNKLALLLSLAMVLLLLSCGASPQQQAGGSDMPNGKMSGIVVSSTGSNTANSVVTLKSIRISSAGTTELSEKTATVSVNGTFEFSNVTNGNYIISTVLPNGESAILSRISKSDTPMTGITVTTAEPVTVYGCVVGMNGKADTVYIPGTTIAAPVDANGFYTLDKVPTGDVEITFSGEKSITVLPVTIEPTTSKKRVNIRNCSFANNDAKPYEFHQSEGLATLSQTIVYSESTQPSWYAGTDFSGVVYPYTESIDSRADWNFPVVVQATPATIAYFGGSIETIRQKLSAQFEEINTFFRDPQFTGKITFSIDSVGKYEGSAADLESVSERYSLRLVLDGNREIKTAPMWDESTRTGVISYDNSRFGGIFGDSGTVIMKRILAQSRGAQLLSNAVCGIQTSTDIRSNEQFCLPSLLLWGAGGTSLDNQTVAVINKNSNTLTPSFFPSTANLPTTISMIFTKNGERIKDGKVSVVGVVASTGSLYQTPTYRDSVNFATAVSYSFPDPKPFSIYSNFSNFKISLIHEGKNYTFWLPRYEASASWFSGKQLEHISHFEL